MLFALHETKRFLGLLEELPTGSEPDETSPGPMSLILIFI
jgi:hypothetical protein